ncbi:crAss001_48 related protein [Faecalibacter sp. LW9]|uniref:crAss001_48 related protein n=1 Tax=Faecalibacter sp. LW9 TaxID=3103144 RepID=UPI002AFF7C5B|nr:hypothetical protein [Faecalibacter sp. LW9]
MNDIQSVIDRLENINANLENPHMPDAIHVEALKEIIPEVIQELKEMKNKKSIALYPHQERVVIELKELTKKRDDLLAFFDTPTCKGMENQDQNLLTIQLEIMDSYIRILEVRIDRFHELNYKEQNPSPKNKIC